MPVWAVPRASATPRAKGGATGKARCQRSIPSAAGKAARTRRARPSLPRLEPVPRIPPGWIWGIGCVFFSRGLSSSSRSRPWPAPRRWIQAPPGPTPRSRSRRARAMPSAFAVPTFPMSNASRPAWPETGRSSRRRAGCSSTADRTRRLAPRAGRSTSSLVRAARRWAPNRAKRKSRRSIQESEASPDRVIACPLRACEDSFCSPDHL